MENKINDWKNKVQHSFNTPEAIVQNIVFTLNNFAHRYLSSVETPEPEIVFTSKNKLLVTSLENKNITCKIEVDLKEVSPERGEIILRSERNSDFKIKKFTYTDLAYFRKNFALALEEVCEIFV